MVHQSAKNGGIMVLESTGVDQEEDEELLRGMITDNPLFGLLKDSHMKCLKVLISPYSSFFFKDF